MNIRLIDHFPLSIKAQIKRQIRAMIEDGRLVRGGMLPSAKELGLFLNINRNTAAAVYKELEQEGFLKIIKGSGTYVKAEPVQDDRGKLRAIFEKAFSDARRSGFTARQITDFFITGLLENSLAAAKVKKVILIDCNYEVLETLDAKLKTHVSVETRFMLIQDIQAQPVKFEKRTRDYDLVLCGMNHLEELRAAVADLQIHTISFLIRTDFHIMNQILQLPPGTKVGYCCISKKSSRAFFTSTLFPSGTSLTKYYVGIDDKERIREMIAACQVVFATHYVYDQLLKNCPGAQNVHRVELDIDHQNFEYILSALGKESLRDGSLS